MVKMAKKYKACLVGCGPMEATINDEVRNRPNSALYLPYSHAAAYKSIEDVELVAVADVIPERVEATKQRYGVVKGYTDYRKMIEVEKPLCCSMEEADAMVEACEKYGVKFNCGTQRRYMPLYRKIWELIKMER